MPKTSGPTGANGSDNLGGIHLTLQGKGGVGKSLIASVLAQYFREHGRDVRCVDTDPVNRTLAQYSALGADRLNLRDEHNRIDQRSFDTLMERFLTEDGATFVVDNGASTFLPLWHYLLENSALEYPAHLNPENTVGTVQSIEHTLRSLERVATQQQERADYLQKTLTDYQAQANRPFEHEERLKELLVRQAQINALLDLDKGERQIVEAASDRDDLTLPDQTMEVSARPSVEHSALAVPRNGSQKPAENGRADLARSAMEYMRHSRMAIADMAISERTAPCRGVQSRGAHGEYIEHPDHQRGGRNPALFERSRAKRSCGEGPRGSETGPSQYGPPQGSSQGMARPVDGGVQNELVLHHVRMQRFGRKKESFSCVETDFKKEASVLANTAATRFGWPNGGKAGKKSRRCLGGAPTCRRAKPRR